MGARLATWIVCGPLGHLAAGVADSVTLYLRYKRARRQETRREISLR